MKKIVIFKVANGGEEAWAISFNGRVIAFNNYGAALSEAKFLMHYCAFVELRGESEEGAIIIRLDEVVNPDSQLREKVEVIVDETYNKQVTLLKLEKWS